MMLNWRLWIAVGDWLGHEAAGREQRAEKALKTVFSRFPTEAPSAHFLERVLAGAGFALPARAFSDLRGFRLRALVVACGALVAVALTFLPSVMATLWLAVRSGKALEVGAEVLVGGIQRLAQGVAVWETLAGIGEAVTVAVSSPATLGILALCALVSATAFRLLQGLLISDRRPHHVEL